ncbi:hypothetical protein BDV93DRAFT_570595 [Ceratobasidium sp. AG-I]|nr:hypothetical protein BDV93DRAFT_570595 [Ceratobasidium sp. AG-I]
MHSSKCQASSLTRPASPTHSVQIWTGLTSATPLLLVVRSVRAVLEAAKRRSWALITAGTRRHGWYILYGKSFCATSTPTCSAKIDMFCSFATTLHLTSIIPPTILTCASSSWRQTLLLGFSQWTEASSDASRLSTNESLCALQLSATTRASKISIKSTSSKQ